MLRLQLTEARKGRQDALLLGLGAVDAAQQRLGQSLQRLCAEAPANEIGQRLVRVAAPGRDGQVERHPQLAAQRQDGRARERDQPGRDDQHHALGHRLRPALGQHVGRMVRRPRTHKLARQPQIARELHTPGLLCDERVGAALDHKIARLTGDRVGQDLAAESAIALDECVVQRAAGGSCRALQVERRAEAADAAADDYNVR